MTILALFAALILIAVATASVYNGGLPNPSVVRKRRVVDTYSAEAVAAGTFTGSAVEVPRGARNIKFHLESPAFDRTTGDETYDFKIQTSHDGGTTWHDVAGLAFTQIATASPSAEQIPTAANAPGVVLGRHVRAHLTSAGTTPIATVTIAMIYESTGAGGGEQFQANYQGG